ncbi:MAG: hypothetical protein ABI479_08065 [Gallionella sp.]
MMETNYVTRMNNPAMPGEILEQQHSRSEIMGRAETVVHHMSLEGGLATFSGLSEVENRGADGDTISYVDKSGNPVEFTEELQLKAAISVLNSGGNFFEATPVN